MQSYRLATYHARRGPSEVKICVEKPSWTPKLGQRDPKIAQYGLKIPQDWPKIRPKVTSDNGKILLDMFWSLLGPILGLLQTKIDRNVSSKLLSSSPQDHNTTSQQLLCEFFGGLLARKTFKNQ